MGILAYSFLIRGPAECMSLHAVAKHMHRPTTWVVRSLMQIISYALHHREPLIFVGRTDEEKLTTDLALDGWCDASHSNFTAITHDDPVPHPAMLSYCGSLIRLHLCLLLWKSFMPKTVAPSTRDSECMATTRTIRELIGMRIMLDELGFTQTGPTPVYTDSSAVEATVKSDKIKPDSRWMGIRIAWIRQCVRDMLVDLQWRAGNEQLADVLTKVLTATTYHKFRRILMNLDYMDHEAWT